MQPQVADRLAQALASGSLLLAFAGVACGASPGLTEEAFWVYVFGEPMGLGGAGWLTSEVPTGATAAPLADV